MDYICSVVEKYASNLAKEVEERTKELVEEKRKCDDLLYRMLPKQVVENLKFGRKVEPENFENVTIFFSDVVEFTKLARFFFLNWIYVFFSKCTPLEIVAILNDLYTVFDSIIEKHDVYKVETVCFFLSKLVLKLIFFRLAMDICVFQDYHNEMAIFMPKKLPI